LFFGLFFNFNASAANIKCNQTVVLKAGEIDKNEYALNVDAGCSELTLDVSGISANKINNLVFDAHDINQDYVFDITYLDGGVYKQLYLDKDVDSKASEACKAYKDVVQPKFEISVCFKEIVLGINQQTKMIKMTMGMKAGKEAKSTEYAYFKNFRVNANATDSAYPGGENYRRIRNDYICSNYRFHDLDAVFTGQVTSVTDLPNGDEDYPELKNRYRFEVEKVLKGNINQNEKLVLIGESNVNVMSDNKYYIVYAQQLRDDKFKPVCIKQLYSPDEIPEYLTDPFDDIDEVENFKPYIVGLYYNGIVSGYGDSGLYYPGECVKRSHLAKFLVNTFGFDINTSGAYFPDVVNSNSELDLSIMTLYNLGIVRGYSNGYYMPDECVTREQAAAFIVRALQAAYPDIQFDATNNFPDINGSAFALQIAYLYNIQVDGNRVINGNSQGYFEPRRPLTRGEMAKMMYLIWSFKAKYRDVKGICFRNGGSWIDGVKECEGLSRELCLNTNGTHSCQSRDRVRTFEEEEIEVSIQSSCGEQEVSVCSYTTSNQPTQKDRTSCVASGNVYVECAPCKYNVEACALICNMVNKCVTQQAYCEQYLGARWNAAGGGCSLGSYACENFGGKFKQCEPCPAGQVCATVCKPLCTF
jgi:hypothetical protein